MKSPKSKYSRTQVAASLAGVGCLMVLLAGCPVGGLGVAWYLSDRGELHAKAKLPEKGPEVEVVPPKMEAPPLIEKSDDATRTPETPKAKPPKLKKRDPEPKENLIAPFIPEKEISERVAKAGGKAGKVNVSLAWNNRNDLDLHVVTSTGEKIYYAHRRSRCGGQLDVDQNVSPTTRTPVENIFWPANSPPKGNIKIYVHHFANHRLPDCTDPTIFTVRVQLADEVKLFRGSVDRRSKQTAFVAEIPIVFNAP